MNRKAQVLIIILWILITLTILAVGIGHRVSLALRISKYQRDKIKALYLARAGMERAIAELKKDTNNCDGLIETWSTGKDAEGKFIFKDVELQAGTGEKFTVKYPAAQDDTSGDESRFIIDAESKININTASKELLETLLGKYAVSTNPSVIADNILVWRTATGVAAPSDEDLGGYTNKRNSFSNVEELMLVKDVTPEIYNSVKDFITVYGSGMVNLNTAGLSTIEILIATCVKQLEKESVADREPGDLANRIHTLQQDKNMFANLADMQNKLQGEGGLTSAQLNIFGKLASYADVKSTCFYIVSSGKIERDNFTYTIECVYDRQPPGKIVYYHESP